MPSLATTSQGKPVSSRCRFRFVRSCCSRIMCFLILVYRTQSRLRQSRIQLYRTTDFWNAPQVSTAHSVCPAAGTSTAPTASIPLAELERTYFVGSWCGPGCAIALRRNPVPNARPFRALKVDLPPKHTDAFNVNVVRPGHDRKIAAAPHRSTPARNQCDHSCSSR